MRIRNSIKHLKCSVLQKQLTAKIKGPVTKRTPQEPWKSFFQSIIQKNILRVSHNVLCSSGNILCNVLRKRFVHILGKILSISENKLHKLGKILYISEIVLCISLGKLCAFEETFCAFFGNILCIQKRFVCYQRNIFCISENI